MGTNLLSQTNQQELQTQFFQLESVPELAKLLEIDHQTLIYHIYKSGLTKRYKSFYISKSSGEQRLIQAPCYGLKLIQRKLAFILSTIYTPHEQVHGYVSGKSIVTNAFIHVGQKHILNVDLKDFFPSINFGRVRGMFIHHYNMNPSVATALAQICCFQNQLPQGAPTSPIISNMLCSRMDRELFNLAQDTNSIYSRYADDITFSNSNYNFPYQLGQIKKNDIELGSRLKKIIRKNGFSINEEKIRIHKPGQRKTVTGLVVNRKTNVNRKFVRQIRAMLYAWEKYDLSAAQREYYQKFNNKSRNAYIPTEFLRELIPNLENEFKAQYLPTSKSSLVEDDTIFELFKDEKSISFKHVLRGKIAFLGMVKGKDDEVYLKYLQKFLKLAPEFQKTAFSPETVSHPTIDISQLQPPCIHTEGKTDVLLMKAALSSLQQSGKFGGLKLDYQDSSETKGDDALLKECRTFAKTFHFGPKIFIFDRDIKFRQKEVTTLGQSYKAWDNNVYSFILPTPTHRKDDEKSVSIELLFKDEDLLQEDQNRRRFFFNNEFKNKSGRHINKELNLTLIDRSKNRDKNLKLIDSDVYDEDEKNVALSKNDFSNYVYNQTPPFNNMDFSSFIPLFEIIESIINRTTPNK